MTFFSQTYFNLNLTVYFLLEFGYLGQLGYVSTFLYEEKNILYNQIDTRRPCEASFFSSSIHYNKADFL